MSHYYVRLSRGLGFYGWVIKLGTWSEYSHVGLRCPDGQVWDAAPGTGVSRHPERDTKGIDYFALRTNLDLPATPDNIEWEKNDQILASVAAWYAKHDGEPYDWSGIFGFFSRRDDWHKPGSYFCSEALETGIEAYPFPLLQTAHLNRVTPGHIGMSPLLIHVEGLAP